MNLEGTEQGDDPFSVQDYVNTYFFLGTQKSGTQFPISPITSFPLNLMVSIVGRFSGSPALHLETWMHMHVEVECMQGALFEWCSGYLPIMKKQLSDCKRG